jgi:hypothetical protein
MVSRLCVLIGAVAAGFVLASFFPEWPQRIRTAAGFSSAPAPRAQESDSAERVKTSAESKEDQQAVVKLSQDEIKSAGIESTTVQASTISHRVIVPDTIIPHADHGR